MTRALFALLAAAVCCGCDPLATTGAGGGGSSATGGGFGSTGGGFATTGGGSGSTGGGTGAGGGTGTGGGATMFGDGGTLTVAEWNIQFFGKADAGPTNDALQGSNVALAVSQLQPDLMAFEEVCDETLFNQTLDTLKNTYGLQYSSIIANNGSLAHPFLGYGGSWGQKVALIWKPSVATMVSGQLVYRSDIDSQWGSTFGSRDPMEIELQLSNGEHLFVIVVHLKADADSASYDRRVAESNDLKFYLDDARANDNVLVLGDFNDDVDTSISGGATPFANFVNDSAHYSFPTKVFSDQGISTTVSHGAPIDHHLVNKQLFGNVEAGSPLVVHPQVTSYSSTTSDHYPTVVRYHFP